MKDIGGWIFGIVMLFFAVANNVFLTKENETAIEKIEHLQNRLNTCTEWNDMFLQVITKREIDDKKNNNRISRF